MSKSSSMPWVKIENRTKVYKFNIFVTDLAKPIISKKHLISIINAHLKNGRDNLAKDWQVSYSIRMYGEKDMLNPKLFKGDRIPIYVVYGLTPSSVAQISGQADPITDSSTLFPNPSYQTSIQSRLNFPVPNCFPDWTPWGSIDLLTIQNRIITFKTNNNIHVHTDFKQYFSGALSWVLLNICINDALDVNKTIDFYAPIIDTWHYAVIDGSGNCTNSVLDPVSGYYLLPTFKEQFPDGGYIDILNIVTYNSFTLDMTMGWGGRLVGACAILKSSSYYINKWAMQNYRLPTYWDAYYKGGNLKYDKMELFKQPLDNYLNVLNISKFIYNDGTSYAGSAINNGPATYLQLVKDISRNFPPNYTYVTLSPLFPLPLPLL